MLHTISMGYCHLCPLAAVHRFRRFDFLAFSFFDPACGIISHRLAQRLTGMYLMRKAPHRQQFIQHAHPVTEHALSSFWIRSFEWSFTTKNIAAPALAFSRVGLHRWHTHTYIYIYIYTNVQTHRYTDTHTHTHT